MYSRLSSHARASCIAAVVFVFSLQQAVLSSYCAHKYHISKCL